ncbi:MAG: PIG-L family deacetylase [Gemmatimonadota bacterium]|jgi:LmbE family N-acetylglucosaminyl deacetylase
MAANGGSLRLMAVLAHPDDESFGFGGTLAHYSAEGVETCVVTATRGESGRYGDGTDHPGPEALGRIREAELRAAAAELGVGDVRLLGYPDGGLDRADPAEVIDRIVAELRRFRPHVVVTFSGDGSYGHPDHIAICQFTSAAVVRAAAPAPDGTAPHTVSKLYWMAWPKPKWDAYEAAFRHIVSTVDGVSREPVVWPDWEVTTLIDTSDQWSRVWRAVLHHESQLAIYGKLRDLPEAHHRAIWGSQEFYRVFSQVNGGRTRESDLFAGLR